MFALRVEEGGVSACVRMGVCADREFSIYCFFLFLCLRCWVSVLSLYTIVCVCILFLVFVDVCSCVCVSFEFCEFALMRAHLCMCVMTSCTL
mmetsp:Transcript_67542/g.180522  ORF Transcript_67542/g.180522 Transcript_67542/m.180522 type:complete len:92 (+) Transcript_67542:418-693(+)